MTENNSIGVLDWYGEKAEALARYSESKNLNAMMAVVTELSLDAGIRATKAIQEALDAEKANQGWQPINDAPRGGVEFQAWIQSYGWEPRCRFNYKTDTFEIFCEDYYEDAWDVYPHMIPTHYMDLPKGPVE